MLLEISGEITLERVKDGTKAGKKNKTKQHTQLWMRLVMEVKSDAVKSNIP